MADLQYRTKGNALPDKRPRVYFTCHPDDFDKSFNRICDDIFKTHDCAVYYTKNMNEYFDEQNLDTDLGSMNLFVIPVTFKLLTKSNRAMDFDFPYAQKNYIPVLPVMLESGIDEFYSRNDRFGELQYLNPYSTDLTEISYEDKLKKYLESVLISEEVAKRVRAAFDAYIFLSYRKKDRRYANELMRLIHSKPEFRDIAVWYDEFLTPGESFNKNIAKMLNDSELFTLLVTPNLLEEPNGKPNFVMGEEYPMAKDKGMDILPVEMEDTDKSELNSKFESIPECVNPHDDELFRMKLLQSLSKIAKSEGEDEPEHNFLIGLAYLDGIDVEVDRTRGVELITLAAEADLPEALERLYYMYSEGRYVELDYNEALKWIKKLVEVCRKQFGEEHSYVTHYMVELAFTYKNLGEFEKAFEQCEKVYETVCKKHGEDSKEALVCFNNLAGLYDSIGNSDEAIKMKDKAYTAMCCHSGEETPEAVLLLNNLAYSYGNTGNHDKALEFKDKAYKLSCKVNGEEHPDTLKTLSNLAHTHGQLKHYDEAKDLGEKAYKLMCKVLEKDHPDTLKTCSNLAYIYDCLKVYHESEKLNKKIYAARCRILGEEHPDTITSLNNLAHVSGKLYKHKTALQLQEKAYNLMCKSLGEDHPSTLLALNNLAYTYGAIKDYKTELELNEKAYRKMKETLEYGHPYIITVMHALAQTYYQLKDNDKALDMLQRLYVCLVRVKGKEHEETLKVKEVLERGGRY